MKKALITVIILILIGGGIYFLRPAPAPKSDKPVVKIGVVYPMTGNAAFFGDGAKIAVALFHEDLKKQNSKYDYDILFEDSMAQPMLGVKAAQKLITFNKINVLVDCFSGVSAANSQVAEAAQIPHLAFAQDINISKGFYNWRAATSDKITGQKMVEALESREINRIVIITKNAGGPVSMLNGFLDQKPDEIKIVNSYYINPDEKDFRSILQKIKSEKPQIILLLTQSPETDIILRQAKEMNLAIPFTGIQSFMQLNDKSLAEGTWYVNTAIASDREWLSRYQKIADNTTTNFAENMYGILQIIYTVYEKSPQYPVTSEDFINNLPLANGLQTPFGSLVYDKKNQNFDGVATVNIIQNGRIKLLEE